jgi:hypothetical protein
MSLQPIMKFNGLGATNLVQPYLVRCFVLLVNCVRRIISTDWNRSVPKFIQGLHRPKSTLVPAHAQDVCMQGMPASPDRSHQATQHN